MRMFNVSDSQEKTSKKSPLFSWLPGLIMIFSLMAMPLMSDAANGSCAGSCGGSGGGAIACFCDNDCWAFGDCCPDVCDACAATLTADDCSPGCGPTRYAAATGVTPPCATPATTSLGPGERVDFTVTQGATYNFNTCSSSWDTEITGYTYATTSTYDDIFYNDDGCGAQSTVNWTATFSGTLSVVVHEFRCNAFGSSGGTSAVLSYSQTNNLSILSSNASMCPGDTPRSLSASPSGGTFTGTGGSVSGTTFTPPTTPGSYTVTYTLGACSVNQTIVVDNPGAAPTSINASATSWCPGDPSITLTRVGGALGTNGTYEWYSGSCGGTPVGSGNSITFTPPSGVTNYYIRAENDCGETSCATIAITRNTESVALASISTNNNNFCPGGSATLTANGGTAGSGATVQWYTGPAGTGTSLGGGATKLVTPGTTTTYYARYEGTCNTTTDAQLTLTVKDTSVAPTGINSTNGTLFCTGSATTNLTLAGGSPGTGATIEWYTGSCGGTPEASGLTTITVNPSTTTSYFVRYEDDCGNTTCASIELVVSTGLTVDSIVSVDLDCFGDSDGELEAFVSGGIAPYSYAWSNGGSAASINGLTAGNYTVTVTDTAGCTATLAGTVGTPTQISVSVAASSVDCNGAATGSIIVTASGGTGQLFYSIDSGFTYVATDTFNGLTAGDYGVFVQDANGCVEEYASNPVQIIQPSALNITGSASDASCNGVNDGQIAASATGGTPAYGYSLNGGAIQPTGNFPGLTSGVYDVIAIDANGCQDTVTLTINNSTTLTLVVDSFNNVTCNGDADGAFTVTASNGFPPYEYSLNNITFQSSGTFAGLSGGSYAVIARDVVGCEAVTTVTITEPAALVATIDSSFNVLCNGDSTGSAYVSATGGSPGAVTSPGPLQPSDSVTFALDLLTDDFGGETTWDLVHDGTGNTVASGGPYSSNTSFVENATVASGEGYTFNIFDSASDGICCGWGSGSYSLDYGDGSASFTGGAFGGSESTSFTAATVMVPGPAVTTINYTYLWSNGDTLAYIVDVPAGAYNVTVTDSLGCTSVASVTISEPSSLDVVLANTSEVSCNGGSDGELDISVTGGVPPYTFSWSNGTTTEDNTGLVAGTYDVTVTDANGCETIESFTVGEPLPLVVIGEVTNPTCANPADGAIDLTVAGGAGGSVDVTVTIILDAFPTETGWLIQDASGFFYDIRFFGDYAGMANDTVVEVITVPAGLDLEFFIGDDAGDGICCGFGSGNYFINPGDGSSIASPTGGDFGQTESVFFTSAAAVPAPTYSYLWSNGSTDEDQTGLEPGTYTVVVTDANGCTDVSSYTVDSSSLLNIDVVSVTDVLCNGDSTGAVDVEVTGGVPGGSQNCAQSEIVLTILTDNFPTETDWEVVDASTSTVLASGGGYTTANTVFTEIICVPFGTDIELTLFDSASDGICCGFGSGEYSIESDGSLVFTGGSFGASETTAFTTFDPGNLYSYAWSTGDTTQDLTGVPAGTYSLTVTSNASGCTETTTVTVTEPDAITIAGVATDVACYGDSTGAIDLTVSGGTTSGGFVPADSIDIVITIILDNFPSETSWELEDAGTSTLLASNGSLGEYAGLAGDTITEVVTVSSNTLLDITFFDSAGDGICCGFGSGTWSVDDGEGNVTPSPSGGSFGSDETLQFSSGAILIPSTASPYTFAWSTGDTTEDVSGLPVGTYTVTVSDNNACTAEATYTIGQPDSIEIQSTTTDVTCNGGSNGAISLTVTGGVPFYTYAWSSGQTTSSLNGLTAGTYAVSVTDRNGCVAVDSFVVNEPTALTVTTTGTDALCNGSSDGTATATAAGGTAPYSYSWSSGALTATATGLSAGTYTVVATDANGCTASDTYTVGEPAPLSTTVSINDASCFGATDGSIDVTFAGGTAGYDFVWSNGPSGTAAASSSNTGLAAGTYTITITDANACELVETYTVGEPDLLVATGVVTDVLCYGDATGAIDVTVAGGTMPYTYGWSNSEITEDISGLVAGTYDLTVTDANGCTATYSGTVTQNDSLELQGSIDNVSCNGGADGSVYLTTIGGVPPYTFAWSNSAVTQNIVNVAAGTYTVVVTDGVGCATTDSFTVTEPDSIAIAVDATNIDCYGAATGAIDITVTGGTSPYNYSWSNGAVTEDLTGLTAGTYTVIVTDDNGCIQTSTTTLTENTEIVITGTTTDVTCFGLDDGTATVTVTGGVPPYGYAWTNGDATATADSLAPGSYDVVVTDSLGCTATATYTITQPDSLALTAVVTDVTCAGDSNGTVNVTVTGGTMPYTYVWDNGAATEDLSGLAGGTYNLTVTDANSCTATGSYVVAEPDTLMSSIAANNVTCYGFANGSTNITVTGGTPPYSYFWSNFRFTENIYNLDPGQYFVIITDANGCERVDSVLITEPDPLTIIGTTKESGCVGETKGQIDITVTGGTQPYEYLWSPTGDTVPDLINLGAGTYTVVVTDANGCTDSATYVIVAFPQPTADFTANLACQGQETYFVNNSSIPDNSVLTYDWDFGDGGTDTAANPVYVFGAAGTFDVTLVVTSDKGCQDSVTQAVVVNPVPDANIYALGDTVDVCTADSIVLTVADDATNTYFWNTGDSTSEITVYQSGTYAVTVVSAVGCASEDTIAIDIYSSASVTISPDTTVSLGFAAQLTATGGVAYDWSPVDGLTDPTIGNPLATPLENTTYSVTVTVREGCFAVREVTVSVVEDFLVIPPNIFSPNGDGINDLWVIENIWTYPICEVIVFNRWGSEVFSTTGYENDWDGTSDGSPVSDGTYYYILKCSDRTYKGAVTILR